LNDVNGLGIFDGNLEQIAEELGLPMRVLEEVFNFIREVGPIGFCSRNAQEYVRAKYPNDPKRWTLVEEHASDLEHRRDDSISAARDTSQAKSDEMLKRSPKKSVSCDLAVVEWHEGRGYEVYITSKHDDYYILPEVSLASPVPSELSTEERQKLKELRQSINEVKQAIKYRNLTLLRVGTELIRSQPGLLENDYSSLKPLTRQEVADRLGMHQSTVSRAVSNKYIKLPHDDIPLQDFFSPPVKLTNGGHTSARAVQERIRALIQDEDKHRPLSDPQLAEMLKAEGVVVARTTVAKYRHVRGIASKQRRRVVR